MLLIICIFRRFSKTLLKYRFLNVVIIFRRHVNYRCTNGYFLNYNYVLNSKLCKRYYLFIFLTRS